MNKQRIILIVVAITAIIGGVYWLAHRHEEQTDDATIEAHAIPMIAKVSGYVTELHIDDNQIVKQGDALLAIDPRDYQIAQQHDAANLASAQAQLTNANINLKRMQSMNSLARSTKDLDNAVAAAATAEAAVATAQALLAQADKDLADTQLIAPADGVVTERGVEQGAFVQPGTVLFYIVTPERWVVANFKETQLADMKPGQKVDIKVDAYKGVTLHGMVDSIQRGTGARFSVFPPQNATGNFVKIVQRVPVKITLDSDIPPGIILGPGMSAVPVVHTK